MSLRLAAASTVIALAVTACAGDGGSPVADDSSTGTAQAAEPTDPAGVVATADDDDDATAADEGAPDRSTAEALWWSAETVDGGELVAADFAGGNVVLWLWAPWCSVCNREAPEVAEALADLPDDVTIVGVAGRDAVGPMQDFVAEHDLGSMTHVVDADGAIWASYGISYQPAWVFIDAEGHATVAAGMLGYDGLFAGIDEAFRS